MKRLLSVCRCVCRMATVNAESRRHIAITRRISWPTETMPGDEHPVKTAQDWAIRRRHILNGMQQAMGPLPRDRLPPLDIVVREEIAEPGGVRRQTDHVASGDGDRVTAYLYIPPSPNRTRLPAMLALHQTSTIGKGEVAVTANRRTRPTPPSWRRGYVVVAPDYPSFGDSQNYDFQAGQVRLGHDERDLRPHPHRRFAGPHGRTWTLHE